MRVRKQTAMLHTATDYEHVFYIVYVSKGCHKTSMKYSSSLSKSSCIVRSNFAHGWPLCIVLYLQFDEKEIPSTLNSYFSKVGAELNRNFPINTNFKKYRYQQLMNPFLSINFR